jgi:hypothetical protein
VLARLCPPLQGRFAAGRVRLASFTGDPGSEFAASVELEGVAVGGARLALPIDSVTGRVDLTQDAVHTSGLRVVAAGAPFDLDLSAHRGDPWRVRFDARADRIELAGAGGDEPPRAGELPPELLEALAEPVRLLRSERHHLASLQVEGRVRAAQLRAGGERLRDLRLVLSLEDLTLVLHRIAFRRSGRLHEYAGRIDLNPLVPDVAFAEAGTFLE